MFIKIYLSVLLVATVSGFYDLSLTTIEGKAITADKWKGKYIALAVIDAKSPDPVFLAFLDSMQLVKPGIQVLTLPATDLTSGSFSTNAKDAYKNIRSSMVVLKPAAVQATAKDRLDLARWLTTAGLNGHFQIDDINSNSLFVISATGELTSVLAGGFPIKALTDALQ